MSHYFRVRAFVDGQMEEAVCLAFSPEYALKEFAKVEAPDTGDPFGSYPIEVAMVHQINFDEAAPCFVDVTHRIPVGAEGWRRASYANSLKFYAWAKAKQAQPQETCHA